MWSSISWVSRNVHFEVSERGEQKSLQECLFALWSSISSASRKVYFEVGKRGEQKSFLECSFAVWSSISWATRNVCFKVSKRDEEKSRYECSLAMWSSIGWASRSVSSKWAKDVKRILLSNIVLLCDLRSTQRVAAFLRSEQKRWTEVWWVMFVCHLIFDQLSEWQRLLRSEKKR
jgi:hypothetical protein